MEGLGRFILRLMRTGGFIPFIWIWRLIMPLGGVTAAVKLESLWRVDDRGGGFG